MQSVKPEYYLFIHQIINELSAMMKYERGFFSINVSDIEFIDNKCLILHVECRILSFNTINM